MIVAGFGFRAAVQPGSLRDVLGMAQQGQPRVMALAAPADKIAALAGLAKDIGLPVIPIAAAELTAMETVTRSPASQAARNTGSVAEASALAAAGPGARLIATRRVSPDGMATCAIAQTDHPRQDTGL